MVMESAMQFTVGEKSPTDLVLKYQPIRQDAPGAGIARGLIREDQLCSWLHLKPIPHEGFIPGSINLFKLL